MKELGRLRVCVLAWVHGWIRIWHWGVFLSCFSTLFFETESLTEPGTHRLARLADPWALGSELFLPLGFCECWWSNLGTCACTEGVLSTEQAPQSHVESFQAGPGGGAWLAECSHPKDPGLSHQHCWEEGVLASVLKPLLFVKLWERLRKKSC